MIIEIKLVDDNGKILAQVAGCGDYRQDAIDLMECFLFAAGNQFKSDDNDVGKACSDFYADNFDDIAGYQCGEETNEVTWC